MSLARSLDTPKPDVNVASGTVLDSTILLSPRPLARTPGVLLLLPLLPAKPTLPSLPVELWATILEYAFNVYDSDLAIPRPDALRLGLLIISKSLMVSMVFSATWFGARLTSFTRFHSPSRCRFTTTTFT